MKYLDEAKEARKKKKAAADIRELALKAAAEDSTWGGPWKWLDALMSCSFANQHCDTALGNTPQQRFMGVWSDGVPVVEPQVTDDPILAATPTP